MDERIRSRGFVGKTVISEETGKKFGVIGDVEFVIESGELLNLILAETTENVENMNLQRDSKRRALIPFSSVRSVGDFVIVSEKDIV